MMVHRKIAYLLVAICLGIALLVPGAVRAQAEIEIAPQDPSYRFGDYIRFEASIFPAEAISEVLLLVQVEGVAEVQIHPVLLDSRGDLLLELNPKESPLRAFSNVEYWYQVNFENGDTFTSPRNSFYYGDNRFQWKSLESAPFNIHWYIGDVSLGEQVLNVALEGLQNTQNYVEVFLPEVVEIYVYEDPQAMQGALSNSGQNWIAGHADPDQGVAATRGRTAIRNGTADPA
jgi:hypothetical protein